MQELANALIDSGVKCWACPVFDNLFAIISDTAAAAYKQLSVFGVAIFVILFTFFIINAVWQNIKKGMPDPFFQKSLKPVLIKSLLALSILTMGLTVPRLISRVTFEPAATITLECTKTLLPADYEIPEDYPALKLKTDGFFNPELRDTVLKMIEMGVASFQIYIKIGIAIMDAAFSLKSLLSIGSLIKHFIIFFIGVFLTYNFTKLFVKYSFCFLDIIVAMAMFAFFFPISIVLFVFKDAPDIPGWMKNLGGDLGLGQIKKLINAIVSMSSSILTYTVIILLIRGYLNANGVEADTIRNSYESLFQFDLDHSDAMQITFAGCIVLIYVITFISNQIPEVTKKILEAFGVKQEDSLSKEMGENVWQFTNLIFDNAKKLVKTIANPEEALKEAEKKGEDKKGGDKKDDKKEAPKEEKK